MSDSKHHRQDKLDHIHRKKDKGHLRDHMFGSESSIYPNHHLTRRKHRSTQEHSRH